VRSLAWGILTGVFVTLCAAPSAAQNSLLPDIEHIRATYPPIMSEEQKAELLNHVAWLHRAEGWGLLRKDGGARCAAPQGVYIACDILVYAPTAWHFDVLADGQIPAWQDAGPCISPPSGCDMARFVAPVAAPGQQVTGFGDVPVPGEYDGDGVPDVAVFRTTTGEWFIAQSSGGARVVPWGWLGDIPVPADFDGDRRTDVAVFRPSTAQWFIIKSSNNTGSVQTFGAASGLGLKDGPLAGDYDRDGRADLGIYRFTTGEWFILRSSDGGMTTTKWGAP
jgi:FG-GAP-like repeat